MEIKMSVNLECPCCTAAVYRVVGLFLQHDEDMNACLMRVDVDDAPEMRGQKVSAVFGWDMRPGRDQIRLIRRLWEEETNMGGIVIGHDVPGMECDFPAGCQEVVS